MTADFLSLSGAIRRIPRRARAVRAIIAEQLTDTYEIPEGMTARDIVATLEERGYPTGERMVRYHQRVLRLAYQYYHAPSEDERQKVIGIKDNTANPLRILVTAGITTWEQLMERVAKVTPQTPEPPPPAPEVEPLKEVTVVAKPEAWFAIPESQLARLEKIGTDVTQALRDAEAAQVRLTETMENLRGKIETLEEENSTLRARARGTEPTPTLEDLGEKRASFGELLISMQQVSTNRRNIQKEALLAKLPKESKHHQGARIEYENHFLDLALDLPVQTQEKIEKAVQQLCGLSPGNAPGNLNPRKPKPGEVLGLEVNDHTRVCDASYDIRVVFDYLKNHEPENRRILFRAVGQREGAYRR